jgi:N-acetylglucosamine-6-phosphate deacetylase
MNNHQKSLSPPLILPVRRGRVIVENGTLILPDRQVENAAVVIRDGVIDAIGRQKMKRRAEDIVLDARGGYIAPGFVDLHVHGGDGADFMDGTPQAVRTVCRSHLRHGTTTIFPTTTTGSPEQLAAMVFSCAEVQKTWTPADGARIAGVHFYGPYFAPDKVGCHKLSGQRSPDVEEYVRHFSIPNADCTFASGRGKGRTSLIRVATCAAELPGAVEFYRFARRRQCLITCGHSNASWREMANGFDAGMRHVDHFWCAMSSVSSLRDRLGTPMQASMEEFVLANPEMSTEVIADGCHLSPELIEFAYRIKGANRLCLVTDASRAVDMPPGRYRFGPHSDGEWFVSDGSVGRMPDSSALASSVAGMDRMVRTAVKAASIPLHDAIRMASLTPAERAGIADQLGSLEPGKRGDVLVLSKGLLVKRVMIAA